MKHQVIYADPPWDIKAGPPLNKYTVVEGKQIWTTASKASRDTEYKSMSVQEIKDLPVNNVCSENAHLYIWTTNKHLPDCFEVIKAWGFKYSTTIVWAKNMVGGGLGGSWRINTEFLLFAKRGKLSATGSIKGTWHNVKRDYLNGYPQHSKKPEYFRGLIEQVSPGPYLEMFARKEHPGWSVFGNEVSNSIVI